MVFAMRTESVTQCIIEEFFLSNQRALYIVYIYFSSVVVSASSSYKKENGRRFVVEECYGWAPVKVPQEGWKSIRYVQQQ